MSKRKKCKRRCPYKTKPFHRMSQFQDAQPKMFISIKTKTDMYLLTTNYDEVCLQKRKAMVGLRSCRNVTKVQLHAHTHTHLSVLYIQQG